MNGHSPSYYSTTDDFSFGHYQCGIVQLNFGPTSLHLTREAAQDLLIRLNSFLTLLEHGPADAPGAEITPFPTRAKS